MPKRECPICGNSFVHLVWDHCHDCGEFRGWICDDCNKPLTTHLIDKWGPATAYLKSHECPPPLFRSPRRQRVSTPDVSQETRRLYMGNGGGDMRSIRISTRPNHVSIEQAAAILGVTAGTARDIFNPRTGANRRTIPVVHVPHQTMLNKLNERWATP